MPMIMAKVQSLTYITFYSHPVSEVVIAFSLTLSGLCYFSSSCWVDTFYQELPGLELIAMKLSRFSAYPVNHHSSEISYLRLCVGPNDSIGLTIF